MQQFPHRISIQQKSTTPNDFGEEIEAWGDVLTAIYANVRNLSGRETKDSDQTQNFVTISVRIRKRSGIHDDLRILHGSRILRVLAVLPDPTMAYLDLKCEEWTDAK
jgi:SPP1 family predicted phage head-tail adaptor